MLELEFDCAPSIPDLLARLQGQPGRFLLEDVPAGTAIVGAQPAHVLTATHGQPFVDGAPIAGDPLDALRQCLAEFGDGGADADVPFAGGAVGWFSYDLGRCLETIPSLAAEDVPTPDICLGFYDSALCIDLPRHRCTAISWSGDRAAAEAWRALALSCPKAGPLPAPVTIHCPGHANGLRSDFTEDSYKRAVRKIKDYISAGDIYQANLAQRFEADLRADPWRLYATLRRINPAPKACYIELGPLILASASPETFLTYDPATRLIVTKPIKGTRPRGRDNASDARLVAELAASEKDRAENLMIVDMLRNDLGRVATYGSVRVPKLWDIEKHPNVLQMVSTVEAELDPSRDPVDLIRASFPGGSITGAPKIRAMEIVEELEPHRRGIYTGSAGSIDYRGAVDLSIVIRSFIISGRKAYFHSGAGIVADSDPDMEYRETLDKIAGLRLALAEASEDL